MSGVSDKKATDDALFTFRIMIEMAEAGREDAIRLLHRLNVVLEKAKAPKHEADVNA